MPKDERPLSDDLLSGIPAIAAYTGQPARQIRHLIAAHDFPHIKRGRLIYSRKSWIDAYFSREAEK